MICPACGAENREGARFCRRCGYELAAAVETPPPSATAEEAPAQPVPGGEPVPEEAVSAPPAEEAPPPAAAAGPEDAEPEAEEPPAAPEVGEPEAGPELEEHVEEPEAGPDVEPPAEEPDVPPEVPVEEPSEPLAAEEAQAGVEEPAWVEAAAEGGQAEAAPGEDVLVFWREEAEPLEPLEAGTLVAGRYRLVEALDVQPEQILYRAEDMRACWQCGFEGNAPKDTYCSQCGAALETRPETRLVQVPGIDSRPDVPAGSLLGSPLEHEGQVFLVLSEARPSAPAPEPFEQDLRLVVGHQSDTGRVRELDEDSLLAVSVSPSYESHSTVLGLFAVADGMGGHEGGEIASKLALRVLAEHVLKGIMLPELAGDPSPDEDLLLRLQSGVAAANDAVYLARQKRANDMGTTLTAILVRDSRLFVAHVGDCRAYRWNAQGLEQLTTDHSVVASMIANGQAEPDEIYSHPHRSIIYRSIGDKPSVEIDAEVLPLAAGDRLVICSDGLWEMVRTEGIADVMLQEADPQAACDLLVKHANLAGGEDNISIVVVSVEAA